MVIRPVIGFHFPCHLWKRGSPLHYSINVNFWHVCQTSGSHYKMDSIIRARLSLTRDLRLCWGLWSSWRLFFVFSTGIQFIIRLIITVWHDLIVWLQGAHMAPAHLGTSGVRKRRIWWKTKHVYFPEDDRWNQKQKSYLEATNKVMLV